MGALTESLQESCPACFLVEGADEVALWDSARSFAKNQPFHLQLRLPPSRIGHAYELLTESVQERSWGLVTDLQRGSISFTLPATKPLGEQLQDLRIVELEKELGAVAAMPDDLEDREARWDRFNHPEEGARKIGDRIKIAFDPTGILLPLRPVAGSF